MSLLSEQTLRRFVSTLFLQEPENGLVALHGMKVLRKLPGKRHDSIYNPWSKEERPP